MWVNRGVCSELGTSRLLLDLSSEIPPERQDLYPPCLYVPSTAATLPRLLLPRLMRCRKWGQPEVILALTLHSSGLWESSILVTAGPAAGTLRPVSVPPAAGISPRLLLVAPHSRARPLPAPPARSAAERGWGRGAPGCRCGMQMRQWAEPLQATPPAPSARRDANQYANQGGGAPAARRPRRAGPAPQRRSAVCR